MGNLGDSSGGRYLMHAAGMRAAQYAVDTGECVFCNVEDYEDERYKFVHEKHCIFHGYAREDLRRAVLAAMREPG